MSYIVFWDEEKCIPIHSAFLKIASEVAQYPEHEAEGKGRHC
jgi:hypothetical protein